jgi:hypothetical protein
VSDDRDGRRVRWALWWQWPPRLRWAEWWSIPTGNGIRLHYATAWTVGPVTLARYVDWARPRNLN